MAGIGTILSVVGTGLSVVSGIQQGKAQAAALEYEAQQHERKAKEEIAAAQREALDKRHETELVLSKQKAIAAASGGGLITPSVIDIFEETATRGAYHEGAIRYGGKSRAAGERDAAAANRLKADAAKSGAIGSALATGFSGLGKAFG